ncbi:FAD-dependent oxidoreductase [Qipengyuania sp. ASV99]|uniref:FAD-dependent oxidoreductase n=1 Tax=Qipengyuania sp. ASV99 TaxID=3399681 RepID=UPI003A4C8327
MTAKRRKLVLIGGGHAHVAVLADWIRHGLPCDHAVLLTPSSQLRYSGMVPGWIAGRYDRGEGTVDLAGLAQRAGAELILGRAAGIDPAARFIETDDGTRVAFDLASIDTGGVGVAVERLGADPRLMDVRPIDRFVDVLAQAPPAGCTAVVGGGAGGTELAFALRNRDDAAERSVVLVAGAEGLLPGFADAVRANVLREFARQGIEVIAGEARFEDGSLFAGERSLEPLDLIVAALGSGAPEWPASGGLASDAQGFVAVDRYQRSISHPHIFAAGDVAARQDRALAHSGVHAVFAGPVLAANLRAALNGQAPQQTYQPRWNNLYLLSTGDGAAIASYGPFSAQGRCVGRLKHWIDTRWISKYSALANGR